MLSRRGLLFGGAAVAAPAIIRPGILMSVKRILMPEIPSPVVTVMNMRDMLLPRLTAQAYRDFPHHLLKLAAAGDEIVGVVVGREVESPLFCGDVVALRDT